MITQNKSLILCLLAFTLLIFSFSPLLAQEPVSTYIEQGQAALNEQNYQEAVLSFEKALALQPNQPDALLGAGLGYLGLKEYEKSAAFFKKLLPLAEKPWQRAEIYTYLGDISLHLNQLKEGQAYYDAALEINPAQARALYNRGYIYFLQKDQERAFKDLNQLLAITPFDRAYYLRGEIYRMKGDAGNAEKDYSAAIDLNPLMVEAYYQLMVLWDDKRQYEKEVGLLEEAARHIDNPEIHYYLARAYSLLYLQMEQNNDFATRAFRTDPRLLKAYDNAAYTVAEKDIPVLALDHYQKAQEYEGHGKDIALARTMLLQDLERYDEAEKLYLEWSQKEPREKEWLMGLARNYTLQNQPDKALKTYEQVLSIQPDDAVVMDSLAALYYYGGQYAKSLEYSRKALKINPKNANFYYNIGFTYQKIKQEKESEASFNKVLELEQDSAIVKLVQAQKALKAKEWKKAEELSAQAQVQDPQLADAYYYRGLALYGQGRFVAAQLQMEESIRIENRDPEYFYQLGRILIAQDKQKAGEKAFAQAALLNPDFFKTVGN